MALPETRMNLAVKMAERAVATGSGSGSELTVADRIAAFRQAYALVAECASRVTDGDAWAEDTLNAAWALADDAFPKGAPLADIAAGFEAAHAAIVETVEAPPIEARQPSRPRRDS